jgi:hypothetical protein
VDDILNPRRALRVAIRCAVRIQHQLDTWQGETEDIGPGGCQIVTSRVVEPGTEVKLAIACAALHRAVAVMGRVIWARAEPPVRLGIAFEPEGTERAWLGALVQSNPGAQRVASGVPERLPRSTRLYLGKAPERVVDFTPVELDILRRVGSGTTVDALARSFGATLQDRTRGALFALVARRCLVFDPASGSAASWRHVLDREGDRPPAKEFARRALGAGRSLEAQRLYDEALGHIGSGRLKLALERLNDALQHSPDDATIASTAKRISRWA